MKRKFMSLIIAMITFLGISAQNTYNMIIEMNDGTKLNIGPNDIKNISFMDGKLTVGGESIDDIKKEIAELKKKVDEQKNCDCSNELEALKKEIANLNTSDIIAMINVLQMQIQSLTNEVSALKGNGSNNDSQGGGNDDQGGNGNNSIDKSLLIGKWYLKTEQWYDWTNGMPDMSKAPSEKSYEDYSTKTVWEIERDGDNYYITEYRNGKARDKWSQVETNIFRNREGTGRDRIAIKSISEKSLVVELFDGYYGEGTEIGKTSEYGILSFMK